MGCHNYNVLAKMSFIGLQDLLKLRLCAEYQNFVHFHVEQSSQNDQFR